MILLVLLSKLWVQRQERFRLLLVTENQQKQGPAEAELQGSGYGNSWTQIVCVCVCVCFLQERRMEEAACVFTLDGDGLQFSPHQGPGPDLLTLLF